MAAPVTNREETAERLGACQDEIRRLGVVRLALSDLLESRLGRPVELVTTEALSPFIGPRILADAQDVLRAA
jgi:predicted nucleotidyltransferase